MVAWGGLLVCPLDFCPRWGGLGVALVPSHVFNSYKHGRSLASSCILRGGAWPAHW